MSPHALIGWHPSPEALQRALDGIGGDLAVEREIGGRHSVAGWCPVCSADTRFLVRGGATFEDRPNLREGLRCERCRLTARQRLLHVAALQTFGRRPRLDGAVLERQSRLYRALRRAYPRLTGSEYLGDGLTAGRRYLHRNARQSWRVSLLRHESITALSYGDGTLDGLVHGDVLEHVRDTATVLAECRRVLRPGGAMVFTVPFFPQSAATVHRGTLDDAGRRVDLLPPELHGDGVRPGGIYTWHNFGRDLFDRLAAVFDRVEIGLLHAPEQGLVHADAVAGSWNMPPLVLRTWR